MANAEGTAGSVLKTAAPLLNFVPYVGPLISAGASIGGGLLEQDAAKKQQEQAARAREAALKTPVQQIRPEFIQKQNMDKMLALSGLPAYDQYVAQTDADVAKNARAIRESSGSGAQTLAAISAATGLANEAKQKLQMTDANARLTALKSLGDTTWNIGEKQRSLEDIRDRMKAEGLQGATALENAATFNKINAAKGIIGGISQGVNQLGANAMMVSDNAQKNDFQQQYLNYLMGLGTNSPVTQSTPNVAAPQVYNYGLGNMDAAVPNVTAPALNTGVPTVNVPDINSFWGSTW